MRNLTVFNNNIVSDEKCTRFFIDACGQGFTAPCCYHVNEYGKINTREYDTFVKCHGDKSNCIMYIYNLNKTDIL